MGGWVGRGAIAAVCGETPPNAELPPSPPLSTQIHHSCFLVHQSPKGIGGIPPHTAAIAPELPMPSVGIFFEDSISFLTRIFSLAWILGSLLGPMALVD